MINNPSGINARMMKKSHHISFLFPVILLVIALLLITCATKKENDSENNCILLGFAFYPGLFFSENPENYVNTYDSDIMLIHFGDNVPWAYLQNCPDLECANQEFKNLINSLEAHANNYPGKVYLSVSALSNERNAPSNDWNNAPPPADNFADTELRDLYKLWVAYLENVFHPDYISQGVEINMYQIGHPEDFSNLLSLMKEIKQNTENVTGPSVQWEFYKKQTDEGMVPEIPFDEIGYGYVFSTYPHILDPEDTGQITQEQYNFEDYGITIDKPLFIAECGIQHHSQASMVNTLFGLDHLEAVIWFFKEDADTFFNEHTGYPFTVFQNSGLYTDAGEKNPGAEVWEEMMCN